MGRPRYKATVEASDVWRFGVEPQAIEAQLACKSMRRVRPRREHVARAALWIEEFAEPAAGIDYQYRSYALKHAAERWWQTTRPGRPYYVSNGAFIVAALDAGYAARAVRGGVDAAFAMKLPGRRDTARRRLAGFIDL